MSNTIFVNTFRLTTLTLVMATWLPVLNAQPFSLDDRIQPIELVLGDFIKPGAEKPDGRIVQQRFTQEQDTAYYFVKGLSMYSPTFFTLTPAGTSGYVKVNLCQENWHVFHQTGQVSSPQGWSSRFKTEGDFGIMVIAQQKPASYALLVWTGPEFNIKLPSVFKGPENAASGGGFMRWVKSNLALLIGGLVAGIIIVVLLIKLNKKKS